MNRENRKLAPQRLRQVSASVLGASFDRSFVSCPAGVDSKASRLDLHESFRFDFDSISYHQAGMNRRSWLTAKRLRAHGLLLALTVWCLYLWTLATPGLRDRNANLKGTDFLHFYTLGSLAIEQHGADLYNIDAQATLAAQRVPAAAGIRYLPLYPPLVSLLFAPLAYLPYSWALALWWISSASTYALCCYAIWRSCPHLRQHRLTVAILAA